MYIISTTNGDPTLHEDRFAIVSIQTHQLRLPSTPSRLIFTATIFFHSVYAPSCTKILFSDWEYLPLRNPKYCHHSPHCRSCPLDIIISTRVMLVVALSLSLILLSYLLEPTLLLTSLRDKATHKWPVPIYRISLPRLLGTQIQQVNGELVGSQCHRAMQQYSRTP
jgi:hypothetical protein